MMERGLAWKLPVAALVAEGLAIAILIVLVALLGPRTAADAQVYAERLGRVVGPVAGALSVFLLALWVARGAESSSVRVGLLLGLLTAIVDALILAASTAPFDWLFVGSNAGRLAAGAFGGWVVARLETAVTRPT